MKVKLKHLIKPFSYNELVKEAEREGWIIPSSKDLENQDISYDEFWISDPITDDDMDISETHAHINQIGSDGNFIVANKNFIMSAIVIVKPCTWKGDHEHGAYRSSCDNIFITSEGTYMDNGMIYCPFCGKLIEEAS